MTEECEPRSCEVGGRGLILPIFGDSENSTPAGLRAVIYMLFLIWFFLGVAIGSDVFMGAIEKITSKKKRILDPNTLCWATVPVWNDTVANLTLMALGSSAPEILLSIIELLGNSMRAGDLGPSTIVGSAAFNMLSIIAVCVSVIPDGETRRIEEVKVFMLTATFSIFAYLWLLFIVSGSSPDEVEIWEGVFTFLFFPVLVLLAYLVDIGFFKQFWPERHDDEVRAARCSVLEASSKQEFAALEMEILKRFGTALPDSEVAKLMDYEYGNKISRAAYRIGATRKMCGSRPVHYAGKRVSTMEEAMLQQLTVVTSDDLVEVEQKKSFIEFTSSGYSVLENAGKLDIPVRRRGGHGAEGKATVMYQTRNGSAKAGEDYGQTSGELIFNEAFEIQTISVPIMDDEKGEDEEYFFVDLIKPRGAELGRYRSTRIRIIDDDCPGKLKFEQDTLTWTESVQEVVETVTVERMSGCSGVVTVKYFTEDHSAVEGIDYRKASGILTFADGEESQGIHITILPRGRYDEAHEFRLILEEPTGGATFFTHTDGGADREICTVRITSEQKSRDRVDRVYMILNRLMDKSKLGSKTWKEQFTQALAVNGGEGEEEEIADAPTRADWVMHYVTIFWKLLFACIPPADYCGGWLCFFSALFMIGLVTAFIGDLASLLGCVLGIPDAITAISFVALGTSLPDTFASKTTAVMDPTADASVGNVTGSNSVNVFLGLGLPWLMASIYWAGRGEPFVVKGGNLSFSVTVFSFCAAACLGTMAVRRLHPDVGAELGGPRNVKYATSAFFVGLWILYVGLSSWNSLSNDSSCL